MAVATGARGMASLEMEVAEPMVTLLLVSIFNADHFGSTSETIYDKIERKMAFQVINRFRECQIISLDPLGP